MKLKLFTIALAFTSVLSAQDVQDVARFSQSGYLGDTRFIAMGGAFVSLGNSFSSIHFNPAGLAVFRRSEINISMGNLTSTSNTQSSYQTVDSYSDVSQFTLNNIGLNRCPVTSSIIELALLPALKRSENSDIK